MNDDIVTRLRDLSIDERPLWRSALVEAADEIERLRVANFWAELPTLGDLRCRLSAIMCKTEEGELNSVLNEAYKTLGFLYAEAEITRKMAHDLYVETKRCGSLHDTAATNNYEQWVEDREG